MVIGISIKFKQRNSGGEGGLRMLQSGERVFQGAVRALEDAMETFLFKVQGIFDSFS